jgi:hypothetical protein
MKCAPQHRGGSASRHSKKRHGAPTRPGGAIVAVNTHFPRGIVLSTAMSLYQWIDVMERITRDIRFIAWRGLELIIFLAAFPFLFVGAWGNHLSDWCGERARDWRRR